MKKLVKWFCLTLMMATWNAFADNSAVIGQWQMIDDKTGKARSVVQLYEQDGKMDGKIVKLILERGENADPICDKCTDQRKGQKILGMVIIEGLKKEGNEWSGGTILDPTNGKTYECKIWLEDGQLKVRGYLGFFYRTQTWLPIK